MLIKMIKVMLSLVLALCLGASLSASPAWAAGSQKQQCDRAVWDCVKKAQRVTCNRPWTPAHKSTGGDAQEMMQGLVNTYKNQSMCKGDMHWWVGPGTTLAKSCPSGNQVVSSGAVDSAIERARREMVQECFKFHVFLNPRASESDWINRYPGRDQNGANCQAFANTFAQCLRDKAKKLPGGPKPHK